MGRFARWIVGGTVVALVGVGCVPPDPRLPPVVDPAVVALDVVPAGSFAPPYAGDVGAEARMYDSLTPLGANVTDADVAAGFKSAKLGFPAGETPRQVERPKAGGLIRRDRFNVPYVTASTDLDARWAVGWLSASHAPLMYEAARRNARLAALRVPDLDVFGLTTSFSVLTSTAAAERALDDQLAALAAMGSEGEAVLADLRSFVAGYNAQLDSTASILPRWTPRDVVALAAFKSDWWGGGSAEYVFPGGAPAAESVARAAESGPSPHRPDDPHGIPAYRPNEVRNASNFALVSGDRSATGHPLMIGGPQIGYMYPAIPFEVDIQSPSIAMRGLTAPSYPGYVFIGRGRDFSWTLNVTGAQTSVGYVVPMCDPSGAALSPTIRGFELDGVCHAVSRTRVGALGSLLNPFEPAQQVDLVSSEYGAVGFGPFGFYGDSGEVVIYQNPSVGQDYLELVAFRGINDGAVAGPQAFRSALQRTPQSFNVGYIDAAHIAAFRTCSCVTSPADSKPVADPDVLRVPVSQQAWAVDPPNGVITNWNEYLVTENGDFVPPVEEDYRFAWFDAFDRVPTHTPTSMVAAMNGEATKATYGSISFADLTPFLSGSRPPDITYTDRSTGIQFLTSFGQG
ncbi:MAG TPA: penicillin acylase family protein [Microthrixaceae bacterium]|nr:penicillin acylase family protein [Microthrixaceae bacterium]